MDEQSTQRESNQPASYRMAAGLPSEGVFLGGFDRLLGAHLDRSWGFDWFLDGKLTSF